jgi:putative membrane protein
MVADHTKTTNDIKAMVTSGDVKAELPSTLNSSSQSRLDKLRKAQQNQFASKYGSMQ